jgi:hypothetical protein
MNLESILAGKPLWVKLLVLYFFLFSTVGFTMFVFEEAMQTAMFAAFSYQTAKDWPGLEKHLRIMRFVHKASSIYIRSVGWLNPLMWPAYLVYLEANESYLQSVESRLRARR